MTEDLVTRMAETWNSQIFDICVDASKEHNWEKLAQILF